MCEGERESGEGERERERESTTVTPSCAFSLSNPSFKNLLLSTKKKKKKKQELSALGLAELVDEGPETPWDILIPSKIVREKKEEEF